MPPGKQNFKSNSLKKQNKTLEQYPSPSVKNYKTCSEEETKTDNVSGNTFCSSMGIQLMWRSELFSRSFERSHFNIYPLVFLNRGQMLHLVISSSTTSQNQSSYDSKVSLLNRRYTSRVNWWSLVEGEKKEWRLIFQLYLSYFNRTPLNVNFSRGCEFYICFTNIWFIHNSSATLWWPKESWPLDGLQNTYMPSRISKLWAREVRESWIQQDSRIKSTIQIKLWPQLCSWPKVTHEK